MVQGLERLGDLDGGVGHAGVEERRGRLQEQNGLLQHTQHTGSAARCKSEGARGSLRDRSWKHGSVLGSDGRGRADLGDWVAEFLGVGHVVAADADDLRARRKELLRRRSRSRHGRQSWWIGGVDEVEVTEKQMGSELLILTKWGPFREVTILLWTGLGCCIPRPNMMRPFYLSSSRSIYYSSPSTYGHK